MYGEQLHLMFTFWLEHLLNHDGSPGQTPFTRWTFILAKSAVYMRNNVIRKEPFWSTFRSNSNEYLHFELSGPLVPLIV